MWDAHKTALRILVRGRTGETGWAGETALFIACFVAGRAVVVRVGLDAREQERGGLCGSPHSPNTTGTSSNRRNLDVRQESGRVLPRSVLTFHSRVETRQLAITGEY